MILVEWSASGVRVFDPSQHKTLEGATLRECLGGVVVRDAVVAIRSRSVFIRTLPVPNLSQEEIHRMIALKLVPLLPFQPGEYVFGFRLGSSDKGKQAVVGAVKTSMVREIYDQAKELGIRVHAIVPLPFGSWLAAKAHGIRDGAVVGSEDDFLTIDILSHGELRYSRSIPYPESSATIEAEIERTFAMAEVPAGPILSLGRPIEGASQHEARTALEYLSDPAAVSRQAFSLELPETLAARRRRATGFALQRAVLAACIAVALGAYEYTIRTSALKEASKQMALNGRQVSLARGDQRDALAAADAADARRQILQAAFQPAQSFTDVLAVLSAPQGHKLWLNGLTLERGRPIVLRGIAATGKELADYMDEISVGDRFRGLRVLSATNGSIGKKSVVQFSVTGWVVGNLPLDAVRPKEGSK